MNLKKNIILNSVLTLSNYLFPFITFPYVSRILGVENIGICNFVDGIIQYYIFFSMMGISILGIREIAKNKSDSSKLNQTFTSLLVITGFNTLIAIIILFISISLVPKFSDHRQMFYIGTAKLVFNFFLIEWFFKGIENFSFITYRSIFIKLIYVILIFCFIKNHNDYKIYYFLTSGIVILNAIINYYYSRKYVSLNFKNIELKSFIGSYMILGSYILLNSMHSTFNIAYLGFTTSNKDVGIYSTATRIIWIAISFISPISNVLLPRVSVLINESKLEEIKKLINQSFNFLFTFCVPIIAYLLVFTDQIINTILSTEYKDSASIIKICSPLVLINGLEQIFIIQILMPYNADKSILKNSLVGTITGLISAIILINLFQAEGCAISWLLSELAILIVSIFTVKKTFKMQFFNKKNLIIHSINFLFYLLINMIILKINQSTFLTIIVSVIINVSYFTIVELFILKNTIIINLYSSLLKKGNKLLIKLNLTI